MKEKIYRMTEKQKALLLETYDEMLQEFIVRMNEYKVGLAKTCMAHPFKEKWSNYEFIDLAKRGLLHSLKNRYDEIDNGLSAIEEVKDILNEPFEL